MGSVNVMDFKNKTTKINVSIDVLKSKTENLNINDNYSEFADIDSILSKSEQESIEAEQNRKAAEEEARKKAEEEARKKAEEEARKKAEEEARKKAEEKKSFWDIAFDYAATAVGSVICGVVDVAETFVDSVAMAGGTIASEVATLAGNEELANEIKQKTSDFVSYDFAENAYDATMDALDVDKEIAHSLVHDIGKGAGQIAGYTAITMVTGGSGTVFVSALSSAGSSAETALQSGATFDEAVIVSTTSGLIGGVTGGTLDKVKKSALGAKTIKDVIRTTANGALISATEPVVNSVTEYETYGKGIVDECGNNLYNSFGEYYLKGGGVLNTFIAGTSGGVSTFSSAYKGYSNSGNKLAIESKDRSQADLKNYKKMKEKARKEWKKKNPNDPRVPLDSALTEDGKIWNPAGNGYVLDSNGNPITQETTIKTGSTVDRYGSEWGCYVGLEDADGNLATYGQRSLAYTESSNTMYNKYKVKIDLSTETLTQKFYSSSIEEQKSVLKYMGDNGIEIVYDSDGKVILPVRSGEIAPCYGCPGGGIQSDLPVSVNQLKKWDFIE